MLAEELSSHEVLDNATEASDTTASTILNAIRDSGKELMSTVNNMLKLNRWAETTVSRKLVGLQDWSQFEDDILYEVDQAMPDHEHAELSIFFQNNLSSWSDGATSLVDMALLKECVQSLVLNSVQATKQGAVLVVIDASADRSHLEVDVIDSGCGIAPTDHARIFEAYEKVDTHSRGAGLGLTLAANIAKLMQGDVVLVSSSQSPEQHGSHFRATVATPFAAFPVSSNGTLAPEVPSKKHPFPFHIVREPGQDANLALHFAKYLEQHGFQQVESAKDSVALVPYAPDPTFFEGVVAANPAKLFVYLTPTGAPPIQDGERERVRLFPGPFTSLRLKHVLADIQRAWEDLQLENTTTPGAPDVGNAKSKVEYEVSTIELVAGEGEPLAKTVPFALLVDDNMVNLKIMRMYCVKRGIEHVTAINGQEALDRFRHQLQEGRPLNLILMDLQMPVCDGIEAVQQIRGIEKEAGPMLASSRIFMVTGQDSSADKARSFAAGADEFYVKPMGMKKLDVGIGQYFPSFTRALITSK